MNIKDNYGQVNQHCDVRNEGIALPLRDCALLRECPHCIALSPVDAKQCVNTNCNTNFLHYARRVRRDYLDALLVKKTKQMTLMVQIGAALAGVGVLFALMGLIEVAIGIVPVALLLISRANDIEVKSLQAEIDSLNERMWV
jgi:hypothetical protein